MNRKYFYVIAFLTLCSMVLIFMSMWKNATKVEVEPAMTFRPVSPFKSYISGVGVVEASSENINLGTPLQRVVEKVLVRPGAKVVKDQPLIQLDDKDLQADLITRQVEYEIALAKWKKLKDYPRPEEIAAAEANLKSIKAQLLQAQDEYEMVQSLSDVRALSLEERNRRYFNYQQAEAKEQQAQADYNKVKKGTWQPDLEIAHLQVLQAKSQVDRLKADLERTIIRSPIDGKVLQIKIHEGELTSASSAKGPMMIVGNTDEKYLEVSINQFNAPYFNPKARAVAFLQGDSRVEYPLEFVSLEPYLVNKKNLTNDITEKVDTRVLQVTYRFEKNDQNIFVGQQMDVFIEAEYGQN